jgi:hypothetical protein
MVMSSVSALIDTLSDTDTGYLLYLYMMMYMMMYKYKYKYKLLLLLDCKQSLKSLQNGTIHRHRVVTAKTQQQTQRAISS